MSSGEVEDVMVFEFLWDLGSVLVGVCNKFHESGVFKARVCERRQENMTKKWGLVSAFMGEFNL